MLLSVPWIMLALLVALMAAVDALLLASKPLGLRGLSPEQIVVANDLRFALGEPLVSIAILLLVLGFAPARLWLFAVSVSVLSLAWVLIRPLRARPLSDPQLQAIRATLLRLNLARWATLIAPVMLLPSAWSSLCFVGAALMWRLTIWANRQLTQVLAGPAPRSASRPAPVALPPPPAPPAPSRTELLLRFAPPGPPLRCASCGAPSPMREQVCPSCGLLFASRVPEALAPLSERGYYPLRPLAAGGMSAVYLAYQSAGPAWCCLKTIVSVEPSGDVVWRRQAAASLAHEAGVLAGLDHPHVSHIRDWFDDPLRPCLVLDLIPGLTLEQALEEGRGAGLPAAQVCAWGQTVAEVLHYLASREQPIAHGDIKPGNLLLDAARAQPTLIDFGSSVRLAPGGAALQAHDAFGTPGYAAPEQYRGQIGLASDVYGLGATLYHLLSGDDPARHPTQFPALPALPSALQEPLAAMLCPDPQRRPAAGALVERLAACRG